MKLNNELKLVAIVLGVFLFSHFLHWYFLSRATTRANRTIEVLQTQNAELRSILVSAASRDSTARQVGTALKPN